MRWKFIAVTISPCNRVERIPQDQTIKDTSLVAQCVERTADDQETEDKLCEQGPSYEYFPKVAKSVLILKSPHLMAKAKSFFAGVEIKITYEGRHHLGAAIGTDEFKKEYVKSKLRNGQKMLKNYHNLLKTSLKQHFQLIP
ncbi:hypothetical protein ACHWQZ_G018309 [Mnemiopsis leidyi]